MPQRHFRSRPPSRTLASRITRPPKGEPHAQLHCPSLLRRRSRLRDDAVATLRTPFGRRRKARRFVDLGRDCQKSAYGDRGDGRSPEEGHCRQGHRLLPGDRPGGARRQGRHRAAAVDPADLRQPAARHAVHDRQPAGRPRLAGAHAGLSRRAGRGVGGLRRLRADRPSPRRAPRARRSSTWLPRSPPRSPPARLTAR